MSSDQGPGAPSFGDLFEDPDAQPTPPLPAGAPPRAPVEDDHDLDHESSEASHQVAGFESTDDEPAPERVQDVPAASTLLGGEREPTSGSAAARSADTGPQPASGHDSTMLPPPVPAMAASPAPAPRGTAPADSFVSVAPAGARGPVVIAPAVAASVGNAASGRPTAWDGTVDPGVSSAPATRVDTGRLYRSAGAEGPATLDAIPAIDPQHTAARRVEAVLEKPTRGGRGLTYSGVFVVVGGATFLVALAEALLRHDLGVLTGLALLASSIYAALVVRPADIWAGVVVPPLAYLAAVLTAGQLTVDRTSRLLVDEGSLLFIQLGSNALWILGTTAVCLAIVLVRRRRA